MNYLMVVRSDAAKKNGGDLLQAIKYKSHIEKMGHNVLFYHEEYLKVLKKTLWDKIIIFNVTRIYENYAAIRNLRYMDIVLCPIIQPGFNINTLYIVKNFIRYLILQRHILILTKNKLNKFINQCNSLIFISEREKEYFFKTFLLREEKKRWVIVHNGLDTNSIVQSGDKPFDFISISRIEPKKNIVFCLKLVRKYFNNMRMMIIGKINWYHPIYAILFLIEIRKNKNIIYMGQQSRDIVLTMLKLSKVLINISLLEVSPLVDFEAIESGCKVVSTKYSFTHLEDSVNIVFVNPKSTDEILNAIKTVYFNDKHNNIKIIDWDENIKHMNPLFSI